MSAEYEIIVKPKGEVESTLLQESVNQDYVCEKVVQLMQSLGNITDHDEQRGCPQPVNQGLFIPGTGNGN